VTSHIKAAVVVVGILLFLFIINHLNGNELLHKKMAIVLMIKKKRRMQLD